MQEFFPAGSIEHVEIGGKKIYCGQIETDDMEFDKAKPENRSMVMVRKKAFSCNYRDLTLIYMSSNHCTERPESQIFFPFGSEFSGEVVAVGPEVMDFKPGDRVMGKGTYPYSGAEEVLPGLPTNNASKEFEIFHAAKLVKMPDAMSYAEGATFALGAQTVYSMLRRLRLKSSDRVLITAGRSNTSLMVLAALRKYNLNVTVISSQKEANDFFLEKGVTQVLNIDINQARESIMEFPEVKTFLEKEGLFDCIIDPMTDIYLTKLTDAMNMECRYITCGLFNQFPNVMASQISPSEVSINKYSIPFLFRNIELIYNCLGYDEDLERAIEDYKNKNYEILIDSTFSGYQTAAFLHRTYVDKKRLGKVVFLY